MAQQYIFVDTENVNYAFDNLFDVLKKKAKVVMFYTDANHTTGLNYDIISKFNAMNAEILALYCKNGSKNSLDISLAGQVGYTICKTSLTRKTPSEFIIYSDDKGYDGFVHMMRDRGFSIKRVGAGLNIKAEANSKKAAEAKEKAKAAEEKPQAGPPVITNLKDQPSDLESASEGVKQVCLQQYRQYLGSAGLKQADQDKVAQIILEAQVLKKNEQYAFIHASMRKKLGIDKANKMYTKIKATIKRILLDCQKP